MWEVLLRLVRAAARPIHCAFKSLFAPENGWARKEECVLWTCVQNLLGESVGQEQNPYLSLIFVGS